MPVPHPSLPFCLRASAKQAAKVIAIAFTLLTIGAAIFVTTAPESPDGAVTRFTAGALMALAGLGALGGIHTFLAKPVIAEFTQEGIVFSQQAPMVLWEEISSARVVYVQGQPVVAVFLKKPDDYRAKFDLLPHRALAEKVISFAMNNIGTPVAFMPRPAGLKPEDLSGLINTLLEERTQGQAAPGGVTSA